MERKVVSMEAKLLAVFTSGVEVYVRGLCGELGISRQSFYKYRRRWLAEGPAGLVERSRRPLRSPAETPVEVEDEIVRLRKTLKVDNGAQHIAWRLARDGISVSAATAHRILVRRGMVVPRPERRPKTARRFEWPRPNDAWQIDATKWVLSDNREIWIMDVVDDHSRVLTAARVCAQPTTDAAWDALSHGITQWGCPAHVMSDNGSCFTARFCGFAAATTENDFERALRGLGVRHIRSTPGHPQTCGKLERSHQTTKRWLAAAGVVDTADELQAQLDTWRHHYNLERPHKAARGGTPAERWAATEPAQPRDPIGPPTRASLHTVRRGIIGWHNYLVGIGAEHTGETVLVIANGLDLTVHGHAGIIHTLTVDDTKRYQPTGHPAGRRPKRPNVSDVPTDV